MIPDYQLLDATKHNDMASARDAISRGANIDARDFSGFTAIWLACTLGHMAMAEFLMTQNANLTLQYGKRRQTLMHWAAEHGSVGVTTFLLNHKADVNALQADKSTPLLLAAKHGHHYAVRLLLKHHALLSPRNDTKATARSAAERAGHHQIAGLIDAAEESRPSHLQAAEEQFQSRTGQRTLF